jgi:hypothetical protein
MSLTDEYAKAPGQLETPLLAGLENLDRKSTITFTQYTKYVFAQDGYVFWVATGNTMLVQGSLHLGTDRTQEEDQTIGLNSLIFTSEGEVTGLNAPSPTTMWIGAWVTPETTLQVAFSSHGSYYAEANIWHYTGFAVYPALQAQIVASAADLPTGPIVSNSLPIFMAAIASLPSTSLAPAIPVYPAFLVDDNLPAPYVAIDIDPDKTVALQAFPSFEWPADPVSGFNNLTSYQLVRDEVKLIFYGLNNQQIQRVLAGLMDYSLGTDNFGFCSSRHPR